VSARPVAWTPHVLDGFIHAIAVSGDVAVVGGQFTTVQEVGMRTSIARHNLFAFQLGTGRVLPEFTPAVNGPVLALADGVDNSVYVGGRFTMVNGAVRAGLARVRLADGTVFTDFTATLARGEVRDLVRRGPYLYASGMFARIGGVDRTSLARLDAGTGVVDPGFDIYLGWPTRGEIMVEDIAVTNDGTLLAVDGSFTRVGGRHRYNLALIDVSGAQAWVRPWRTDAYERSACPLLGRETHYMRGLDFSPDGTYLVVVTSGHLNEPRKLCDTAARFNVTGNGRNWPVWVNHTGSNTLLSVEVTGSAVYVGGHQNWLDNTYGDKRGGPGAVWRPGIGAINPVTGKALPWNPTHDRGRGVEVIMAYPGGLLVGSDTVHTGYEYHARLSGFPLQ
jgi:hypothetical protein